MLVLLLGASVALAGGTFTSRSDDGRDDCSKTHQGCVDDLTTDYDTYVRLLDGMIDDLVLDTDGVGQLDAGHSLGIHDGQTTADIWTEQLGGGHFMEHWFLNSDALLDAPGTPFDLTYDSGKDEAEMVAFLESDPGHLAETYVGMEIFYVELPAAVTTAQLNYPSDTTVQRFGFDGVRPDGSTVAHLLREVHTTLSGQKLRFDHWVFLENELGKFELLDDPGDTLHLVPAGSPTPAAFYGTFQADPSSVRGAAVIQYEASTALASGFFGLGFGS